MSQAAITREAESGVLPGDPAEFVATAERIANAYDPVGAAALYAVDAQFDSISDGARDVYRGKPEIERAWRVICAASEATQLRVEKRFLAATEDTIVNDWRGTVGGRSDAVGFERWRFNAQGELVDHEMRTFLNVKSAKHPLAQLRVLLSAPRMALAFLRAERQA